MSGSKVEAAGCGAGRDAGGRAVSLPVLPSPRATTIRASRASRWRAAVLILVHLLIAIHVVQWMLTGMTISPVEPSEAMYTLERGEVNAGFVFFVLALGSTLVVGRWFCGWACHVVALQDGCTWLMNKLGVRPKPWRTRLLVLAPLLLGLYMFVWPTLYRIVVLPMVKDKPWAVQWGLAPAIPTPHFHAAFVVEDFWATFPPWYIAIPFLLVCGFATVYFLGSKGFCTYGCPYGGFFAPVDRLAVGRIVVNDRCEGCGHCTAVCTSNVRVHQEVRDFGMVVDPGCMKCLDCVSVCPNEALSFGFARPAVMKKARTAEARAGESRRPGYDLTVKAELVLVVVGLVLFYGFRGMLNSVPMLMAGGLAAIGAFLVHKAWTVATVPNVRLHGFQLRQRGRVSAVGVGFVLFALAYAGFGVWGGAIKYSLWNGDRVDAKVTVPYEAVMRVGYAPDPVQVELAERAIASFERAGAWSDGGWGWALAAKFPPRLAWLHAVKGDWNASAGWVERSLTYANANEELVMDLITTMRLAGRSEEDVAAALRRVVERNPSLHRVRMMIAAEAAQRGDLASATTQLDAVRGDLGASSPDAVLMAFELLTGMGKPAEAVAMLEKATSVRGLRRSVPIRLTLAQSLYSLGRKDEAVHQMREAVAIEPRVAIHRRNLAALLRAMGQTAAAEAEERAAQELESGGVIDSKKDR